MTTIHSESVRSSPLVTLEPSIRADFPALDRTVHDSPLVYLDSAATSQKPESVLQAMQRYYREHNANVHRGVHRLAEEATEAYEGARARVARFIGAPDPHEIVFTRGTTGAINTVAGSLGDDGIGPDDTVVLTEMEHHANIVPWHMLAQRTGCRLRFVPVDEQGTLDLEALADRLDASVRLVSVVHVSNTLGSINPVADIVRAARAVDALVLLDAAQSAPHMPLDVVELGVDFVAFSGHKMCGPTGIGVLWARRELLDRLPPWEGGGEMIRRVTTEGSTWNDPPWKFEAGTPPIAEAVGLAAAIDYLDALGMDRIAAHDAHLAERAAGALRAIEGVTVYGPSTGADPGRAAVVPFTMDDVHAHDVATILDARGVAIRAGHHCTMPLHDRLGVAATARASFYLYNTVADIDALVAGIHHARELLGTD